MSIIKLNNRAVKDATAVGSITGLGNLVFISRSTASSSASLSITSGIDSTYKEYIFVFNNMHPASVENFTFQGSTDGGSNYNTSITSTFFDAYHAESGSPSALRYVASLDQANGTSFQTLGASPHNQNDEASSGILHLFDPSNTTFVKHFISRMEVTETSYSKDNYCSGYFNTTSAINAIQFKFASGNIDSGTIDMYGVL